MKKTFTLASALVAIIIALIFLSSCGTTAVIKEVQATTTDAPIITPAPVVSKYDRYLEHVYNNSGQANTWTKAKLIEFGDLVCQSLDQNNSIAQVVNLLSSYSKTTSDMELFASVVYGSIHYICDEYIGDLNLYLSTSN